MKRTFHEMQIDQPNEDVAVPAVLYVVQDEWEEGDPPMYQEPHPYAHAHHVVKGKVKVEEWTDERAIGAKTISGGHVVIPAGKFHRLTGEPGAITQCIHVLRQHDEPHALLDPGSVPTGATALSVAQPITVL